MSKKGVVLGQDIRTLAHMLKEFANGSVVSIHSIFPVDGELVLNLFIDGRYHIVYDLNPERAVSDLVERIQGFNGRHNINLDVPKLYENWFGEKSECCVYEMILKLDESYKERCKYARA
ncbi:MAG: hypothetical protein KKD48_01050 [Nanoarchaeota archaeon]|nr:hypothetical protein [Nanoarchaeota archaeon]